MELLNIIVDEIKWHQDCDGKDNDGLPIPSVVKIDIEEPSLDIVDDRYNADILEVEKRIQEKLESRYGWTVEDFKYTCTTWGVEG